MDAYVFCLSLGFLGLLAIAFFGHGFGHHAGAHSQSHGGHHATAHTHATSAKASSANMFQGWLSPRVFFSLLFAFGAAGTILQHLLPAIAVLVIALAAAFVFERWLVQPIWRLLFGFASNPARMLESALLEEAEAVMNFDERGQGLVAVELDGQVMQILATLSSEERTLGTRVFAGERLSITAVNARRNSCTVTRLPFPATPPSTSAAH